MVDNIKPISNITVVIPAYNAEKYIARAIESVLNQTFCSDEILVVDDGSKDNTANIVRSFGDKVKLIQQENAGECAARNTGIKAAVSEWIAFLDADDEWLPDKLELQIEVVRKNPSLMWVTSNYYRCLCGQKQQVEHTPFTKIKTLLSDAAYFEDFFQAFVADAHGCSDTMVVKKEALIEAGLFREGQTSGGDMDMWWRLAFRWPRIGYAKEPLAIYYLGVQGSALAVFNDWQQYSDMVVRNLNEAMKLRKLKEFKPAAVFAIRRWIRGMLFRGEKTGIRELIDRFPQMFSPFYRCLIYTVTIFPHITAFGLCFLSKIVRTLRLRRRVARPPQINIF